MYYSLLPLINNDNGDKTMKQEITTQDRKELKQALVESIGATRASAKQFATKEITSEVFLTKKGKYKAILQAVRGNEVVIGELEEDLENQGYKVVEDLGYDDLGYKLRHRGVLIEKCVINQVLISVKSI